jgi:hypothetical protein
MKGRHGNNPHYRRADPAARRRGGYYGYNRYGGSGLGGALGLVLIVLLVIWLLGGVQFNHL